MGTQRPTCSDILALAGDTGQKQAGEIGAREQQDQGDTACQRHQRWACRAHETVLEPGGADGVAGETPVRLGQLVGHRGQRPLGLRKCGFRHQATKYCEATPE